jgi:hypothetical protein
MLLTSRGYQDRPLFFSRKPLCRMPNTQKPRIFMHPGHVSAGAKGIYGGPRSLLRTQLRLSNPKRPRVQTLSREISGPSTPATLIAKA